MALLLSEFTLPAHESQPVGFHHVMPSLGVPARVMKGGRLHESYADLVFRTFVWCRGLQMIEFRQNIDAGFARRHPRQFIEGVELTKRHDRLEERNCFRMPPEINQGGAKGSFRLSMLTIQCKRLPVDLRCKQEFVMRSMQFAQRKEDMRIIWRNLQSSVQPPLGEAYMLAAQALGFADRMKIVASGPLSAIGQAVVLRRLQGGVPA